MAGRFPGVLQRYRWTELGLFIIPFLLLLLEMSQLLIAKADPHSSLSKSNLPTLQGLIPALGVIIVLLIV
ncbi:MAG: FtsW/RodA/SpoVE family cell cycle protein, partial [Ktedonobacteraceae bacterium]|nr:FtsW/RodA/SpoVE family cell cycle protein [Ktedonobacteraceae bacterium]